METNNKKQQPSAFPLDGYDSGMTLRDYFANSAMQGITSNGAQIQTLMGNNPLPVPDFVAEYAYGIADAMLKQREL